MPLWATISTGRITHSCAFSKFFGEIKL